MAGVLVFRGDGERSSVQDRTIVGGIMAVRMGPSFEVWIHRQELKSDHRVRDADLGLREALRGWRILTGGVGLRRSVGSARVVGAVPRIAGGCQTDLSIGRGVTFNWPCHNLSISRSFP